MKNEARIKTREDMRLMDGTTVPAGSLGRLVKTSGREEAYGEIAFDHLPEGRRVMVCVREIEEAGEA